ncbi:MAG: hypothetical protein WC734_05265 [Patescibacteria group bacterium]|jgi:hypothetical protein
MKNDTITIRFNWSYVNQIMVTLAGQNFCGKSQAQFETITLKSTQAGKRLPACGL